MRVLIILLLLLKAQVSAAQSREYPPQFADARAEVYKAIDDVELKLWIFEPPGDASQQRPAIVFFFGGGWKAGTPAQFEQHCRYLASRGMVAITADYRVRERHQTLADRSVADAKSAIRWVRRNATRLRIDPNRIAAGGGSAGGHLAACTGVVPGFDEDPQDETISSVPNAMVLFNPAVLLTPYEDVTLDQEKLDDIATRTGVPVKEISPIHHVQRGQPPTIIFHGTADTDVPFETVKKFAELMAAAGNRCELKRYDASHGFFNFGRGGTPGEAYLRTVYQMDRFLASLGFLDGEPTISIPQLANAHLRSNFDNSRSKFQRQGRGSVAFIGGSITEMEGYRPLVSKYLQQRFPQTEFTFTAAGISSTCSTTGAFRLQSDVLAADPDLLFVEFAVNDDQDGEHAARECLRGMEGVIRQALVHNPNIDIVITHFVNPPMLELLQAGETPTSSGQHERVAYHYGVASSDLAREVADRITAGNLTWQQYGGTHPKPPGNQLAADLVIDILEAAWKTPLADDAQPTAHRLPKPLDRNSYFRGRFVDLKSAQLGAGWQLHEPDWSSLPGQLRRRFSGTQLLCASDPGAELTLDFAGTAAGAYVLAGPDAGMLEYSIDGGEFKSLDLYHRHSKGLHYPRTVMFAGDLASGSHQLKLRISKKHNQQSRGTAARILHFVAN
jgi:acetyl esterase/lipase/lysophospholipase L1-like esterase